MEENAPKNVIFDTVLTTLKETRTSFFANFISGFALLLTAFGLLFNYEKIKPILAVDAVYFLSVLILIVFSVTYSRYLLSIKRRTQEIVKQLEDLEYMDNQYYTHYQIDNGTFVPMLVSTLVMFGVMILVLSWIKYFS